MKYGMNLLLWSGEVTDDILQVCGQLKEIGYDGVELPIFNLDLDYAAIGSQLDSLGLGRTGVTVRGEEDNPISPDAAVRAKGIELTKKTLDCCAAAGVETLVGPYHSALGLFSGAGPTEDEWKWGVDSMREVAEQMRMGESPLISEHVQDYSRDLLDHALQLIDIVSTLRDSASSLTDLVLSLAGNRMNEVMKVLTIMASLFIPITFLAGVYGMNFEHIPELSWQYAYPAFWAICTGVTIGLLIYFRRKRWL